MDWRVFFDVGITLIVGAVGYLARELWSTVKDLHAAVRELEVQLPKHYVSKEDYRNDLAEIKMMLHKIADKLDAKVDKN